MGIFNSLFNLIVKSDKKKDAITILIIEAVFISIWYGMYGAQIYDNLLIGGDIGIYNINTPIITQFMVPSFSFWNLFASLVYHLSPNFLVSSWDFLFFISSALMPVGIFFLLRQLRFKRATLVIGSLFYSLNPLSILMGIDWEYSILLFFMPIIFLFLLRFYESRQLKDAVLFDVSFFLLLAIEGFTYIKFVIFIIIPMLILSISAHNLRKLARNALIVFISLFFLAILTLPSTISTLNALLIFKSSAVSNKGVVSGLYSIAQFEYSSSSIQGTIFALPYVANQLTSIGYESSWFGLLYFSLISLSVIYAFAIHNKFRKVNLSLIAVLVILLLFQYGVYNGSFINLFKISYVGIYNYPLFFYMGQLFIYAFFFSQFIDNFIRKIMNLNLRKRWTAYRHILLVGAVIGMIALILVSSMPVMEYEVRSNPVGVKAGAPDYITNLTISLKNYEGERIMVLPDNVTSLNYVYVGASESDVYGFPYGYQNFASEFPNLSAFENLSTSFVSGNIRALSSQLETHAIKLIVVLNPISNYPITADGTQLNGGGENFEKIINETGLYTVKIWNSNFVIYTANVNSNSQVYLGTDPLIGNLTYKPVIPLDGVTVVTSNCSFAAIPLNITIPVGVTPDPHIYYDQILFIPSSLSSSINANYSNILFRYLNGTLIPAWIQNLSTNGACLYLKLHGEINRTIEVSVLPENSDIPFTNGYLGEAPQVSGTGTGVLPDYIKYSSVVVGAFGYGYDGNNYTLNFTFNPSDFSNVEDMNLSNVAFYSNSGLLLSSSIIGNPTNTSNSATVSISFPGGVSYFQKFHANSPIGAGSYGFFYIGFANESTNLNALNASINFTSQPDLAVGYVPYAVIDSGLYNSKDNGNLVFPYYNSYIGGYSFANGWGFGIPLEGYGLLSFSYWPPDFAYVNNLGTIKSGMIAETLSYDSGQEASPLFISNHSTSALTGDIPLSDMGFIPKNQSDSMEIGWLSNTTSSQTSISENFNNSASFVYKDLLNYNLTNNLNLYGISLQGKNAEFLLNTKPIFNTTVQSEENYLSISNVWGGSLISYYTLVAAMPEGGIMPSFTFGNLSVFQAYFDNNAVQNPVYSNETLVLTAYLINNINHVVTWKLNNLIVRGDSISTTFSNPGNYTIFITYDNKTIPYNVKVLQAPTYGLSNNLTIPDVGIYNIPIKAPLSSSSIVSTFIDGIMVNSSATKLTYDFKYSGTYYVVVRVYNSAGFYNYSFSVSVGNTPHYNLIDWAYLLYNFIFIFGSILFMVVPKIRYYVYNIFSKTLQIPFFKILK